MLGFEETKRDCPGKHKRQVKKWRVAMGEAYIDLLKAFGFKEMQIWIATISALLFSSNLLGGILSGLMFANSKALRQRPLKERISFRLFLMSEVILLIFVFFYRSEEHTS